VGVVERGDDKPYHAVIDAENFHALQLLKFTCGHQVDCIYIDLPYSTGARDWTYNDDFVDRNDRWRHSKWLSMMDKRLRLARDLLAPEGVLVVTMDEHEVHHLGSLLGARVDRIDLMDEVQRDRVLKVSTDDHLRELFDTPAS
jgi:adenine-specific DNA-methyltransferase